MMLQDIYPHKLDNQYKPDMVPQDNDWVLVFRLLRMPEVLQKYDGEIKFPTVAEIPEEDRPFLQYVFSIGEEKYYLLKKYNLGDDYKIDGYEFANFFAISEDKAQPKYRIYACFTAKHLADWYRDTQFCGRCGTKTEHSRTERASVCPTCGYTAYPRIMPAVIVGVTNGDKILLTKYKTGFAHNALIAGFTEIGETMEETVEREVMEEAGVKVKNIRYYKSQPWGTANDMLLGFYCDVDGDDTIHMDDSELKYAEWVKYDEIIFQPNNYSLTNEMMRNFSEMEGRV